MINRDSEAFPVFSAGVITGAVLFGAVISLSHEHNLWGWMLEHQDLAAGFLALFAAGLTALLILWQIRQNTKIRNDSIERRLYASKSIMPLILSQLSRYAKDCLILSEGMAKKQIPARPNVPNFPEDSIEPIRDCIQFAGKLQQKQLFELLKTIQLLRSRMAEKVSGYQPWPPGNVSHFNGPNNEIADEHAIIGSGEFLSSLELGVRINELWSFARDSDYEIDERPNIEKLESLFELANLDSDDWPNFIAFVGRTLDKRLY